MVTAISKSLRFMTRTEQKIYLFLLSLRAGIALFDLIGIIAIGFLATSITLFLTQGSESGRIINFIGIELPAITAQTLPWVSILILSLFITKAVGAILLTRILAHFLAKIEARAAKIVLEKSFGTNLNESRKHSREEIVFAVQNSSTVAFNGILNHLGMIVAEGFLFILIIIAFLLVSPFYAIGAIIYFIFIGVMIQFFIGKLMFQTGVQLGESSITANTAISDLYNTLKESEVLSRSNYFYEKVYRSRMKTAASFANQYVLSGMPRYIVETSLIVAIAVFVLLQAANNDIASTAGTISVFLMGGLRLTASLLPLQSALLSISRDAPVAMKALNLLEIQKSKEMLIPSGVVPHIADSSKGIRIDFQSVCFQYHSAEKLSIEKLNIVIEPGQQIALVGASGAGKSTIADLMIGLLQPQSGSISLNGIDPITFVKDNPGVVSYLPQKPGLVSGSILDNIALGIDRASINFDQINHVIQQAHLTDVINELPFGIDGELGKHLDELSGGQLQRIGLARALYSKPKLLILDEATSALDANSESEINAVLQEMRGNVTVVIIAHRFKLLQNSDQIFLIEEGKISDSGTYAQLLATNRVFQELASLDNQH